MGPATNCKIRTKWISMSASYGSDNKLFWILIRHTWRSQENAFTIVCQVSLLTCTFANVELKDGVLVFINHFHLLPFILSITKATSNSKFISQEFGLGDGEFLVFLWTHLQSRCLFPLLHFLFLSYPFYQTWNFLIAPRIRTGTGQEILTVTVCRFWGNCNKTIKLIFSCRATFSTTHNVF